MKLFDLLQVLETEQKIRVINVDTLEIIEGTAKNGFHWFTLEEFNNIMVNGDVKAENDMIIIEYYNRNDYHK